MKLTDTACKVAKPKEKPYKMADGGGLYLEVMPHGSKLWRLGYRFNGKESRIGLGIYPEVSLKDARLLRETSKDHLKAGINPSLAKKEARRQQNISAENTFEVIAREWHAHNIERWSEGHGQDILHRLEMDVFPAFGWRPISQISSSQVLDGMRNIERRGAHEIARRTLQYCGQVFRYAIFTDRAENDPTSALKGALKPFKKGHHAALEIDEFPEFLKALNRNEARLYAQTIRAIKLLMLTFVRTSELIEAKWEEFDFKKAEWSIPAGRMKMKRPHIVPLSRQALEILKEQHKLTGEWDWVFPNAVSPKRPMSNNTILFAIGRLGFKGRMTGHGFRALAMSTIKEVLGYRHEVVDRQLAHAPKSQVDAAYDRAKFLPERKKMMQEWADYIDSIS